ncbi:hypothetical protein, partial [Desulfovibrio sp. JC022]|uniref:hypothetical protein n=1 Tax=Desulfovibrio sp. JC022 TaxID=2593642 RepID=UPI0013D6DC58
SDPRIYGTTLAAAALPGVIAGGILAGGELATVGAATARRAAPHVSRGLEKLGKAAKRTKGLVRDTGRKTDINIRTSEIGTKHKLDLDKVTDGATSLFDEMPPSVSKTASRIAAAKKVREQADNFNKKHDPKWGQKTK